MMNISGVGANPCGRPDTNGQGQATAPTYPLYRSETTSTGRSVVNNKEDKKRNKTNSIEKENQKNKEDFRIKNKSKKYGRKH